SPEAIWAKALDMKVLGISCITNSTYYEKAMSETSHEEVVDVAKKASEDIDKLLKTVIVNVR
ncbi:MAG: purine-nucleoside phosphorylase, partial [Candidatus Sericytochromatia bacterium]